MSNEVLRYCDICGRGLDPNAVGVVGTVLAYRCATGHLFAGDYGTLGVDAPEKSLLWRLASVSSNQVMFMPIGGALNE